MCDIKLHQSMNDFSINIHAEDFFKDVINFTKKSNLINANSAGDNEFYIDLVDHAAKKVVQVTSTVTKYKIDNSLKILNNPSYTGYHLEILYLLEKPSNFNKSSIDEFKSLYGISDIYSHLKDSGDLLNDIKAMDEVELYDLFKRHFSSIEEKYTDEIVLQIVFDLLLKEKKTKREGYDDDLGTVGTNEKIIINKINDRVASHINLGLDYTLSIYNLDDQNQIDELRTLVVDFYYANELRKVLKPYVQPLELKGMNVPELHLLALKNNVCFNKLLFSLKDAIESTIVKVDFNSQSVSWIIIAYFFEICDVGVKK